MPEKSSSETSTHKKINFWIEKRALAALEVRSQKTGASISELIRRFINSGLKNKRIAA